MGRRNSTPQFQNPTVINPKVNYSKVFTRHTMKVGYEMQNIHTEVLDFSPQYGQDSYSGQFSAPSGGRGQQHLQCGRLPVRRPQRLRPD